MDEMLKREEEAAKRVAEKDRKREEERNRGATAGTKESKEQPASVDSKEKGGSKEKGSKEKEKGGSKDEVPAPIFGKGSDENPSKEKPGASKEKHKEGSKEKDKGTAKPGSKEKQQFLEVEEVGAPSLSSVHNWVTFRLHVFRCHSLQLISNLSRPFSTMSNPNTLTLIALVLPLLLILRK